MLATTELSMNAVERVIEFSDKKEQEPSWEVYLINHNFNFFF